MVVSGWWAALAKYRHVLVGTVCCCLTACGGGSSGPAAAGQTDGLSDTERAALVGLSDVLRSFSSVLATLGGFAASSVPPEDGVSREGTCPETVVTRAGDQVRIDFDYGLGCAGPATGGILVAGVVRSTFAIGNLAQIAGSMTFAGVTLDGAALTGRIELDLSLSSGRLEGGLIAQPDIELAGVGHLSGGVEAFFFASGRVALNTGNLVLRTASGATYPVAVAGLVVDAPATGSLVPVRGLLRVTLPAGGQAVLNYLADTPQTGTLLVSVDGRPLVPVRLLDLSSDEPPRGTAAARADPVGNRVAPGP